jgi:flagellar basal body-associated protein FliL
VTFLSPGEPRTLLGTSPSGPGQRKEKTKRKEKGRETRMTEKRGKIAGQECKNLFKVIIIVIVIVIVIVIIIIIIMIIVIVYFIINNKSNSNNNSNSNSNNNNNNNNYLLPVYKQILYKAKPFIKGNPLEREILYV